MDRIQRVSKILRLLFQILFYATPVFTAVYWIYFKSLPDHGMMPDLPVAQSLLETNASTRYMAFLVSMLPAGLIMYGLHHIIMMFRSYESGQIFALHNAKRLSRLGFTLLGLVFMGIIYDILLSYVLTFHNPPGHHVIAVTLGMNDITMLIFSGVLIVMAWIMAEAHKLVSE